MKKTVRLTTGGNPRKGHDAFVFKNTYGEYKVTTRSGYNFFKIGVFNSPKDANNQVDIELDENIIEVYEGNKKLILTIGTTVEIEELE